MYDYNYEELETDIDILAGKVKGYEPDLILAIARGGLIPSQLLAYRLHVRYVQSIQVVSYDNDRQRENVMMIDTTDLKNSLRVLIVDDIIDSGKTLETLLLHLKKRYPDTEFKSASIFYKPTALLQPDFTCKEAKEWINFFWDREE